MRDPAKFDADMASTSVAIEASAEAVYATPAELDLFPNEAAPVPPEIAKLHRLLNEQVRLVNQGDSPLSLFINFVVTDSRSLSDLAKCGANTLCAGVPYADLRAKSCSTPAITNIAVDQTVEFPGTYRFKDWLNARHMQMSYADTLFRSLRIEVWQARRFSANTLLGCYSLPFAALLHTSPDRTVSVTRNVASTRRGLSTSVGQVSFRCLFEESFLFHELSFRLWSVAVSSGLFAKSFNHAAHLCCSVPCCCGAVTGCCATANSCTHLLGCAETVSVNVSYHTSTIDAVADATTRTVVYSGGAVGFSAPIDSRAMASAADTSEIGGPSSDMQNIGGAKALSFASLFPADGGSQTITVNTSVSSIERHRLVATVRLKCRRCCQEGIGQAQISLRGVTSSSFLPFTVPISFKKAVGGAGCCSVFVTGGVLRGFILWRALDAPLMSQFSQVASASSSRPQATTRVFINPPRPRLNVTINSVKGLLPSAPDRIGLAAADPRVVVTWGGSTLSTKSKLANLAPVYAETLSFGVPSLPGRDVSGRRAVRAIDLDLPLQGLRHALVQVWDDGSLLPSASGLNLSTDTIQGRRVRRAYLLAEAVITVPMRTLLGITRVDANDAKDANERPVGCRPAQVCGKSNRLASLDSVASTYGLLTPPRGAVSSAFLTSGQQSIQISLSFRLENFGTNGGALLCVPQFQGPLSLLPRMKESVHEVGSALVPLAAGDVTRFNDNRIALLSSSGSSSVGNNFQGPQSEAGLLLDELDAGGDGASAPATLDLSHACWRATTVRLCEGSWDAERCPDWWLALTEGALKRKQDLVAGGHSSRGHLAFDAENAVAADDARIVAAWTAVARAQEARDDARLLLQKEQQKAAALSTGPGAVVAANNLDKMEAAARLAAIADKEYAQAYDRVYSLLRDPAAATIDATLRRLRHVSPLLVVYDRHGFPRALPSLLSPIPIDAALLRAPSSIDGANDAARASAAEQSASAMQPSGLASANPSVRESLTRHLCVRAAYLAASIELSDTVSDMPESPAARSRQSDALAAIRVPDVLMPFLNARRSVAGNGSVADARHFGSTGAPTAAPATAAGIRPGSASSPEPAQKSSVGGDSSSAAIASFAARLYAAFLVASWPTAWMEPGMFLALQRGGVAEHAVFLQSAISGLGSGMDSRTYLCVCTVDASSSFAATPRSSDAASSVRGLAKDLLDGLAVLSNPMSSDSSVPNDRRHDKPPPRVGNARGSAALRPPSLVHSDESDGISGIRLGIGPGPSPPGQVTLPAATAESEDVRAAARARALAAVTADMSDAALLRLYREAEGGEPSTTGDVTDLPSKPRGAGTVIDGTRRHLRGRGRSAGDLSRPVNAAVAPALASVGIASPAHGPLDHDDLCALKALLNAVVSETLHFCVAVLPPLGSKPDALPKLYEIDGRECILENDEYALKTQYRRVLLLANARDVWVNLQLDKSDDEPNGEGDEEDEEEDDDDDGIFGGGSGGIGGVISATAQKLSSLKFWRARPDPGADVRAARAAAAAHPQAALPSRFVNTLFDLSDGDHWLTCLDSTASRGTLGSGNDGEAHMRRRLPTYGWLGPGLGFPPRGGGVFPLGTGLDGAAFAGPTAALPLLKRDLSGLELQQLTSQIAASLIDAIELSRAAAHLGAAVVSSRPGYRVVRQQLRALLCAKARLEMYFVGSDEHGAAKQQYDAQLAVLHRIIVTGAAEAAETGPSPSSPALRGGTPVAPGRASTDKTDNASTAQASLGVFSARARRGVLSVGGVGIGYGLKVWRVNSASPDLVCRAVLQQSQQPQLPHVGPLPTRGAATSRGDEPPTASGAASTPSPWFRRRGQELCLSVIVQQLLSGVLVTRVAAMSVWPAEEEGYAA